MNEAYEAAIAVAFQSQTPTSLDVVIEIEIGAFICNHCLKWRGIYSF